MSAHFDGVPIAQIDSVMLTKFLTNITDKYFVSVVKMTRAYARSVFAEAVKQSIKIFCRRIQHKDAEAYENGSASRSQLGADAGAT
jgi:hypothetical protein